MVVQAASDVDWIKNGIRVNGSAGLEPILRENDRHLKAQDEAIKEIKPKVVEVYDATTKIRSKFMFVRALKAYVDTRPFLKKVSDMVISKILVRLAAVALWVLLALAGMDLAGHTVEKAVNFLIK